MISSSGKPVRRSVRLSFDYADDRNYFVTLCAHEKRMVFGQIADEQSILTSLGALISEEWIRSGVLHPGIILGDFVIMPNHFHALLFIPKNKEGSLPAGSLASVIAGFKAGVSSKAKRVLHFDSPVWQRSFHEHVVRSSRELETIRKYIADNPRRWSEDRYFSAT